MAQREDNGETWCIHRTPFTHEYRACKIGIDFRQFEKAGSDWMARMPCLGRCAERCPSYVAPTAEQIAKRRATIGEAMKALLAVHPEIQ